MGPILAAVVVTEIDGIERFPSAQKLCGYAGLCPMNQVHSRQSRWDVEVTGNHCVLML
jgi:transposase